MRRQALHGRRAAVLGSPAGYGRTGTGAVPRHRLAAARGAWAVGSLLLAIARVIRLVTGLIALLIVAAILLRLLDANATNAVVKDVHDAARFFVGPFNGVFSPKSAKVALAVNWGLAAVVYLVVGGFVARLIARAAPSGVAPGEQVV